MISGHGASQPDAFLINDAAVGDDLRSGYALSGNQEYVLKGLCRDVGLGYESFYKTALIKDKPLLDTSKSESYSELLPQIQQYKEILINEINTLQPKLLIPLGETSFHWLSSLSGIRKFRGSVMLAEGTLGINKPIKLLPILGPFHYIYRDNKQKYISRIDFSKVHKYLNDDPPPADLYRVWIAQSASALRSFLERSYKSEGLLVFDIETYMSIPTCISFCFDGFESVCVPFMDQAIDLDNRVLMIDLVAKLLNSPIRKVNQNVKYDWKILERWCFSVQNICGDTMLAASILYCEFPKNLGFLTSIYTDLPYFKDEGREYDPTKHKKEQFYLYNAKDSLATYQIYSKQITEITEQGVSFVYNKLIELMPIYRRAEDRGVRIDLAKRAELMAKYESLYEIQCMKLRSLSGLPYANPLSHLQMNKLVFDELGFDRKQRGVNNSTKEEALELLMVFGEAKRSPTFGKDILQIILDCRKIHKVIEILELPLYPDGRFRCEFNLAGTETGRSSAGETTDRIVYFDNKKIRVRNLGHSLQTIGKHGFQIDGVTYGRDIRSMFVPSRGYTFVEIDLSQAEARVDAVLAGNYDILHVFDGPMGIHKLTGSWVYSCDPGEIKKNILINGEDRYHTAKTVRHAGERNIKDGRLASMLQIELNTAKQILATFHKFQPKIRDVFHRDIQTVINSTRLLRAPNGRRRDFFDRIDQHTYNEGISFLPQAIVSDQTKFSLIPTLGACPWAHLLIEMHDGTLSEVPTGREREFAEVYKENVEKPIDFRTCSLPREFDLVIPCEASAGDSWYGLEEFKP